MKYEINKEFKKINNLVLNIKKYFENSSNSIHKARNEIKVLNYEGTQVVVKSFKIPKFFNRIVYTFFRDTKAKKSYEYALKIADFTPKPIAYIEFYENYLLENSYFISEEFKYDFTIREPLLDESFPQKQEILEDFARFTYELHENGIFHKDFSPGNILIKNENDNFIFKIVDINRMEFMPLNLTQRLKNFSKLWAKDEDLISIIKEYSKLINEDEKKCIDIALKFSQKHKNKINLKKRIRGQKIVD